MHLCHWFSREIGVMPTDIGMLSYHLREECTEWKVINLQNDLHFEPDFHNKTFPLTFFQIFFNHIIIKSVARKVKRSKNHLSNWTLALDKGLAVPQGRVIAVSLQNEQSLHWNEPILQCSGKVWMHERKGKFVINQTMVWWYFSLYRPLFLLQGLDTWYTSNFL